MSTKACPAALRAALCPCGHPVADHNEDGCKHPHDDGTFRFCPCAERAEKPCARHPRFAVGMPALPQTGPCRACERDERQEAKRGRAISFQTTAPVSTVAREVAEYEADLYKAGRDARVARRVAS